MQDLDGSAVSHRTYFMPQMHTKSVSFLICFVRFLVRVSFDRKPCAVVFRIGRVQKPQRDNEEEESKIKEESVSRSDREMV